MCTVLTDCVYINIFLPLNSINYQAVKAIGRSDSFLHMQMIKTAVNVILLLFALPHGVFAVAMSGLVSTVPTLIINTYPSLKYIGCGLLPQLKVMFPAILFSIPMSVCVYEIPHLYNGNASILLVLQLFSGIFVYMAAAALFRSESLYYLLRRFKRIIRRGNT